MRQGCGLGSRRSHGQAVCLAKSRGPRCSPWMLKPGSVGRPRSNRRGQAPTNSPDPKHQTKGQPGKPDKTPPLRERLAEHWMLATVGAIVLIAALIGGVALLARRSPLRDPPTTPSSLRAASRSRRRSAAMSSTFRSPTISMSMPAQCWPRSTSATTGSPSIRPRRRSAVAQANVDNIEAQIDSQQAQIEQAKAQVDQAEAQLQFAQQEAARAQDLVEKGAGTVQREQQTTLRSRSAAGQQQPRQGGADRRANSASRRWRPSATSAEASLAAGAGAARSGQAQSAATPTSWPRSPGRVVKLARRQGHVRHRRARA